MNYELCKKLKEAGFPQRGESPWHRGDEKCPTNPTLSELIEACGGRFNSLNRWENTDYVQQWTAKGYEHSIMQSEIMCDGSTPEEAVANLWLALNPKSKEE